jgi:hypothetical protein
MALNLISFVTLTAILSSVVSLLPLIPTVQVAPTVQVTAAPILGGASTSTINLEGLACVAIAMAMPKLLTLTGNRTNCVPHSNHFKISLRCIPMLAKALTLFLISVLNQSEST